MRVKLKCPHCSWRLADYNNKIKSVTKVISKEDYKDYDYYIKCQGCKKEIGVIKIN